jgi:hypothetical protein
VSKEALVDMTVILSVSAVRDAPLTDTTNADAKIDTGPEKLSQAGVNPPDVSALGCARVPR